MNDARSIDGARWLLGQSLLTTEMTDLHVHGWKRLMALPDAELIPTLDAYRDEAITVIDGLWFVDSDPVHSYFGLTYANYKVMARSLLQSMPVWWQRRFVSLMRYADDVVPDDGPAGFRVHAVDERGKFTRDPYADYQRGRRRVELREVQS